MSYNYRGELVFFDSIGEEALFYAPTIGLCLLGTNQLINRMKDHLLQKRQFPEFSLLLERAWASRTGVYDLRRMRSRYFHVALGLTENCTLACVYCHADAGKNTVMDVEIIEAAARYAATQVKENGLLGINLSFAVGGEPTFDLKRLKYTIGLFKDAAQECSADLRTSMTTNGYYSRSQAEYIADNIDNILVSIDGPQDVQDLHRPARDGSGSFEKVVASMDVFYQKKETLSVRATISTQNVNRLTETIDFLADRYKGDITFVIEPLVPLGRGETCSNNGVFPPKQMDFAQAFWAAYCYGEQRGIKVRTSALNADRLVSGFCGAMYIPSFTVTTDGTVTTCERDATGKNYGYGKYDEKTHQFMLDKAKIRKNHARIEIPQACDNCICRYHCAGDCPDVRTINYNRCETNKYLLKKYLLRKMNGKGVKTWT